MIYQLESAVLASITAAFSTAQVKRECNVVGFSSAKHYLLIEFKAPVTVVADDAVEENLITDIFAGDKLLTAQYNKVDSNSVNIATAFRWIGRSEEPKVIDIVGLAMTVTIPRDRSPNYLMDQFLKPLLEARLIEVERSDDLFKQIHVALLSFGAQDRSSCGVIARFFSKVQTGADSSDYASLARIGEAFIREHIKPITMPRYTYQCEGSINPAFENLDQRRKKFELHEKRIWVLRNDRDLTIALGVKNAYQESWGYHGFVEVIDPENHRYMDWEDRVGHPSLAIPDHDHDYDGSVYYAGHIAQRDGYLEILDTSGRFERLDLTEDELNKIEAFIALRLQKMLGEQKVIFIVNTRNTFAKFYTLSLFYSDKSFPLDTQRREYTSEKIASILFDEGKLDARRDLVQESTYSLSDL